MAGRWGGRESPHKAQDGGPGSGPKPGGGGERKSLAELHPGKFTASREAGMKSQREADETRVTLNAGGLPKGWKMMGGRKIPPPR
jgi:hypothetical protein